MKTCPFCGEKIQDEAIKCRYCYEFLNKRDHPNEVENIGDKTGKLNFEQKICPKCGFKRVDGDDECPRCGIIYTKAKISDRQQNPEMSMKNTKTTNPSSPNKREPQKLIWGWILGLVFLISFFGNVESFGESPIFAIVPLICAGLLLPPIRKFMGNKTGLKISTFMRIIIILVLLVFGPIIEFTYQLNQVEEDRFAIVGESEQDQTEKILAKLESTPDSEYFYETKMKLYQQLKKLNPDNKNYQEKYSFYFNKFDAPANPKRPKLTKNEKLILRNWQDKENYLNVFGSKKSLYSTYDIRSGRRAVWSKVLERLQSNQNPNEKEIQFVKQKLHEVGGLESSSYSEAKRSYEVESLPGISNSSLQSACENGCLIMFSKGTADYQNCVYCCTHDCN